MDEPEDVICGAVFAGPFPPTLDNSFVVAIEPVAWLVATACKYGCSKEEKAKGFRPPDVSGVCFPAQDKAPSPPAVANDDADACF
jgi:hypothetical protein